jgi:hypothetical protein
MSGIPLETRIRRLRTELDVIGRETQSYLAEARRGSYIARLEREKRFREWDEKYDQLRWLELQVAALEPPAAV